MGKRTHITHVSALCYMDMFFGWIDSEELEYTVVCDKLLGEDMKYIQRNF